MAPQDILTSLKQARPASHSRSAPSSPAGGKTKYGQAFFMAAKHSASKLETWHICVMTKGFDAACPGDVTNTIIAIAPDKSAGSFRHQNRPKLPCFDSILPEPATCTKCSFNFDKALPCLPGQDGDRPPLSAATVEMKTNDSVIDIKRLTQEQAFLVSTALADNEECLSTASDPLSENPEADVTPSTRFSSEDYALWLKFCMDGIDSSLSDTNVSVDVGKAIDEVDETSAKVCISYIFYLSIIHTSKSQVASRRTVLSAITEGGALPITEIEAIQNVPLTFTLPIVLAAVKPLNIIKKTTICTADTSALSTILTKNAMLIAEKHKLVRPALKDVPLSALLQPKDVDFCTVSSGSSEIDVYREPLKDVSNMSRRPGSIRNLIRKVKKQRGHRSDKENSGPPSRTVRSSSVSSNHCKLQSSWKPHTRGISSSASLQTCT
ncbi:hypothetical protein PILCRDRAFT_490604 [Piloderma croceum F 1598]|uniref:Uncharacterized protein n=1 Tax=Piloderma croceum (strain F 1598) TaxID=765440 RepID=A0A0C3B6D7_PILCF|nr:hypothetical protein PILCRDRAFT_490604 [Piloderma croceum F 1598]